MVRVHSLVHGLLSIPTMVLSALHCKRLREGASPDSKSISQFSSEWIKSDTNNCMKTVLLFHLLWACRYKLMENYFVQYQNYILHHIHICWLFWCCCFRIFIYFLLIGHRNRIFVITNVLTSSTLRIFCEFFFFFCPLGNIYMQEIFHCH